MQTRNLIALGAAALCGVAAYAQAAYPAWAEGNTYTAGTYVSYNGHDYVALITHTAYVGAGWTPVVTPTLWKDLGPSSGSATPVPTATPKPTTAPTSAPTATPKPTAAPTVTPTPAGCTFTNWTEGVIYQLGAVVKYLPNGQFYKVVQVAGNGSDATNPTISTWYWQPTTCGGVTPAPTATPKPTSTPVPTVTPTPAPGCNYVTWTSGVIYQLGTIVKYPANGQYYKEVAVGSNGSDATDPTISTYYWQPTTCGNGPTPVPTAVPTPGPTPVPGKLGKIVGGYWPYWPSSPVRIKDVNPNYNLIYLFAAVPEGGAPGTTGRVIWNAPGNGRGAADNLVSDIQYARGVQGRRIILSVGGAGNGMSFPNRTKSQNFVDSIVGIYNQLGGFDGLDWNTFEGSQAPDTGEMIWISQELKRRYAGFIISAPPAPWNSVDKTFCQTMVQSGALDYCAPQYYDGPNLADPAYVVNSVNEWVGLIGETHLVVGLGVNSATNYMSIDQAVSTWKQVKAAHPNLLGAFDWQIGTDEEQGWPFANQLKPLINP
ncbi:Chitinase [Andreprevotia lacus DSM 23236]|jgi:chitinase|uniref:Chitinase n=1 Tax=Andreprevotia lacus DSM 23236 TaxID=1121001 RepID=A0A1W1XZ89_9NEIS|nr:carbohydrate-binding protein [Andreprevotia lacus]SMC29194.1 Chitinase [Andreprevotia lacus DSM 23236]